MKIEDPDEYKNVILGGWLESFKTVIFPFVNYIDQFPDMGFHYGMDFGFTTDPCVMLKYAENKTDIYIELLCYQPIETPEEINEYAKAIGMNKRLPTTADSADKYASDKGVVEMVSSLRDTYFWNISKVSKTKTVMYWLGSMKKKRINIVNNHLVHHAKKEQQYYRMKTINGIAINQPVDEFNHMWDAARYAHIAEHSEGLFW